MRTTPKQQAELEKTLEKLIDQTSLTDVLHALADICHAKAEHIAANWQDRSLAEDWQELAAEIDQGPADQALLRKL